MSRQPGTHNALVLDRPDHFKLARSRTVPVIAAWSSHPLAHTPGRTSRVKSRSDEVRHRKVNGMPPTQGTQVEGGADRDPQVVSAVKELARVTFRARALLNALKTAAEAGEIEAQERVHLLTAIDRLTDSVVRPLEIALQKMAPGEAAEAETVSVGGDPLSALSGAPLWELAQEATRLRLEAAVPSELLEATAALQELAWQFAMDDAKAERIAQLREIQSGLPPSIRTQTSGPYLVTNVERLTTWLGEHVETLPQMAFCRCGQSALKPLCDGSHARVGFTDAKDPKRVPDRRDTYVGQQVTILDNRGICQHSGFCTDRLPGVFHSGSEPFVTPSGGRMDEIIRAVRDCPSGALSFAFDGREARDQVDYHDTREPAIEVSKDGPYRISGAILLLADDGVEDQRNERASREHYALCRCGHSQNKPFCSGMHFYVQFRDPVSPPDHEPSVFEWCGGLPALTRMTRIFYEKYVPQDPLLSPLFSQMSADHPQRVAMWLGEVFGGPKAYSSAYGGYPRMLSQHLGKGLTEERRARWVALITQSAQDAGLPADPEFRSAFGAYIEWGSRLALENSQPGARPPEHMPMPHWDWNTAAGPPGSRISAIQAQDTDKHPPEELPGPDEPLSFEKHIKGLFRPIDRNSMKFAFDLWSLGDVRQHGQGILERLQTGTMPCDGAWPSERIELFQRWLRANTPA
jgi:CDGSH-type Zn-finger protein/truncated hemoglobin YjbI